MDDITVRVHKALDGKVWYSLIRNKNRLGDTTDVNALLSIFLRELTDARDSIEKR